MSNREKALQIIDEIPEDKMIFVINMLDNVKNLIADQEEPNEETIEAIDELRNGGGEVFKGSAHDFISAMLED